MPRGSPGAERDLVIVQGVEPSLRWKAFCNLVVEASRELGVEMVITLGALLADVPHTRPVPITGLASDEEMVAQARLRAIDLRGADRHRRRPAPHLR